MPLRHSVLWVLRDTTTPAQKVEMLRGLAYLCLECRDVKAGDYGDDLFGGTQPLRDVVPWMRSPRWRPPAQPPSNFDVALHLDFDGWADHDAYGADPVHDAASRYNETVAWDEQTARVDWWVETPPPVRGQVRHVAMFVWSDDATPAERARATDAARGLQAAEGVLAATVGDNVGTLTTDFDWILDVALADLDSAGRFLDDEPYRRAMDAIAAATRFEWTARLTHRVRGRVPGMAAQPGAQ